VNTCVCVTGVQLLASAGRDRLIHTFDKEQQYGFVQTLDEHSAAITSVRFANIDGELNMLSCGTDKSLLFHRMVKVRGGTI
jgi:WD40 repeat protein